MSFDMGAVSFRKPFFSAVLLCIIVIPGVFCTGAPEPEPEKEIRIGVIATIGVEVMRSSTINVAAMVQSQLEKNGGLLVGDRRHPVRFVIERIEGGLPEQAVSAVKKLINQQFVAAIIGPDFSIDAIPAGEIAERAGIPLISPLSTHPRTTAGRKYVFRMSYLDSFQARAAARLCVRELKARRIAVLYNVANPYSRGIAETFRATVLMEGGMISAFEKYTTEEKDFSEQLGRIKKSDPEILYLPNFLQEVEPVAIQARKMGIGAIFVGSEAWDRQTFAEMPQFEGSYMIAHWSSDRTDKKSMEFLKEYRSRFGSVPEDWAALTYDGIQLLLSVIAEQGKSDPESIRKGLYALGPYNGITGIIDFIDSGSPQREAVILHFEDGRARLFKRILSDQ